MSDTESNITLVPGFAPYHKPLSDAYVALKLALLPRYPLRELTNEDISNANAPLLIWEQSNEISAKYITNENTNLIKEMIFVLDYIAAYPEPPETEIVPLKERCNALQKKIYDAMLNEILANGSHVGVSGMVPEWINEAEIHVLESSSHDLNWYNDNFRNLLGLMEASYDIEANASIINTLQRIIQAAYLPHFDHLRIVHAILVYFKSMDSEASTIYEKRAAPAIDSGEIYSRTQIIQKIEAIEIARQNREFLKIQEILDFFEAMPQTSDNVTLAAIQVVVSETAVMLSELNLQNEDELIRGLYSMARKASHNAKPSNKAFRPSFHSSDSFGVSPKVQVTFRDASQIEGSLYSAHTDRRKWADLHLEADPKESIHKFFLRFVKEANYKHRHPLFPISDFDLQIVERSTPDKTNFTLKIGNNWFTQGTVSDFLNESSLVLFDRHDGVQDIREVDPPLISLPVVQRQYPPSAPQPLDGWMKISPPRGSWQEISSLQFIGDGTDLTAYSGYPPLIARSLFLPSDFTTVVKGYAFLRRRRVSPTLCLERLAFPLSVEQARSLLGRTVLYEVESTDPGERRAGPLRKRRRIEQGEEDPVYMAFVWGLDLNEQIMKTFEFSEQGELCRTFKFCDGEQTTKASSLPDDYAPLRKVAKFKWTGLLESPIPVHDISPEEAAAIKEEQVRKKKRWQGILEAAPQLFEVGIGGDHALVVGDLKLHPPGTYGSTSVENCKSGIWQSGCGQHINDSGPFMIWVRWLKPGHIDLTAPASAFAELNDENNGTLPPDLSWIGHGTVSVDAGMVGIIGRGILSQGPVEQLTGESHVNTRESLLEMLMLSGSEDGRYHVPGGVSSYTGGDGGFLVEIARDTDKQVIAVRVVDDDEADEE